MTVRELELKEIIEIFEGPLQQDFDPEEIKPLFQILYLRGRGIYPCFGFYEGDVLAAYAFLCAMPGDQGHLLLDYYAVNSALRAKGYGTQCLALLREELSRRGYHGVLAEVERVQTTDFAPGSPDDWRARRIAFYERSGFRLTSVWCWLFGVEFQIMTMDISVSLSDAEALARMDALYRMMLTKESYDRNVKFFLP